MKSVSSNNRWLALVACLIILSSLFAGVFTDKVFAEGGAATELSPYETRVTDGQGHNLIRAVFPLPPQKVIAAPVNVPSSSSSPAVYVAGSVNVLSNVPAFDWSYGCSPTAAAMLFGYYDRVGYSNMYTGPAGGGVCPMNNASWGFTQYPSVRCGECPLSATHQGSDGRAIKGHVDDYWIDYRNYGPDPYTDNWTEHATGDCTADFMGTNQVKYHLWDGATYFFWNDNGDPLYDYTSQESINYRDGCHGMRLFAESRGYTVTANFNQVIQGQASDPNKGFTFLDYKAEIDAGRPVIIQVTGHSMLGYGYDTSTNPPTINIRNTWDYNGYTMPWGGVYNGSMQHEAVTVIRLAALAPPPAPVLTYPTAGAPVAGTSINFQWNASTGATSYWLTVVRSSDGVRIFNQNVGNVTSQLVSGFPNNGTQYVWAVAACNNAGYTASAYQAFINGTASSPPAPVLTYPAAGASVAGTSINFQWNASTGATSYWLTVVRSSDGVAIFNQNVGNVTSQLVSGFPNNGTQYVWAVAACNIAGYTATAYQAFTNGTASSPPAPVLTYPTGGNISGTSITFQWNTSTGATSYWLTIVRSSDGVRIFNQNVGNVTSQLVSGFPNNGTQYVWAVAACNNAGYTASAYQAFSNGSPPPAPVLIYPGVGAVAAGTSVNFQWNVSAGATSYWLTVVRSSDGVRIFNQNVGNVTSQLVSGFPNNGTQYVWAVAASNIAGYTATAYQAFTNGP